MKHLLFYLICEIIACCLAFYLGFWILAVILCLLASYHFGMLVEKHENSKE